MLDAALRRPRWMWAPYLLIAAYSAFNVPVAWILSSPLTVPMWRAAGGALSDSITHYLTPLNIAAMFAVMVAAVILPWLLGRMPKLNVDAMTAVGLAVAATGPLVMSQVDTRGRHRNAITALLSTWTPRIAANNEQGDWRASPVAGGLRDDLTRASGSAAGRNVVIIALESFAAEYLRLYSAGADDVAPNLSAMAKNAIIFDAAYAAYPESIKGLFALLCSRAPAFDVTTEAHAAAACAPLPKLLAGAGYRTGLFHSGRFGYLGMQGIVDQQGFGTAEDAGVIGGNVHSSFGVDEPAAVARMLAWVDGLKGERFFLTYLPIAGHHPYATATAGPFRGASELDAYQNALFDGDRALGALVDGLRSRGLADRTLFVFVGDHGEAFNDHAGNTGHSLFIYDENVRVPLIIAAPGGALPAARVGRPASVVDIAPTVLDLLGLPASPQHEGASLLLPRERMALFHTDYATGWLGLRDRCWKVIVEVETKRTQLYDVCRDPHEVTDRSAEQPALAAAYRDRLERWAAATRAQYVGAEPTKR